MSLTVKYPAACLFRASLPVPSVWVQRRWRGHFHSKKPRPGPFQRRVFEAVTKPVLPTFFDDPRKKCSVFEKQPIFLANYEENEFENFLQREFRDILDKNYMVVVYHTHLLEHKQQWNIWRHLKRKNIDYNWRFVPHLMCAAIEGSKYQEMKPLLLTKCGVAFCEEDKVHDMLKITKKFPTMTLMGGLIGDRLFTSAGITAYSAMPPIEMLHGELSAILTSVQGQTLTALNSHQRNLVGNLQQYVKDQSS